MFNSLKNNQEKIPPQLLEQDRYRREIVTVNNPIQAPKSEDLTTKNYIRDERSGCPLPGVKPQRAFDNIDDLSDGDYGFVPYSVRKEPSSVEAPVSAMISSSQYLPASEDSITDEPDLELWRQFGHSPVFPKKTPKPKIDIRRISTTTTVATTNAPNSTSVL